VDRAEKERSAWPAATTAVGLALLLAYALPLFFPPQAVPITPPRPEESLAARMFPGVPPWWVGLRLVALAAGAVLIGLGPTGAPLCLRLTEQRDLRPRIPVERHWARGAFIAALLLAIVAPWVGRLSAGVQMAYLLLLSCVPLLLALGGSASRGELRPEARRPREAGWKATAAIIALWLVWRGADAWHSVRSADAVDTWRTFSALLRLSADDGGFLAGTIDPELPGVGAIQLFLQGLPVFQFAGIAPSLHWVQAAHLVWLAVSAAGVATLAGTIAGAAARPVAAAVFLFSPFMLMVPLNPTPIFVGPLLTVGLALFVLTFDRTGSPWALAALGIVAGLALSQPALVPTALLAAGLAVLSARGHRASLWTLATPVLLLAAAALPALPDADAVARMFALYAGGGRSLAVLQDVLFGQIPAHTAPSAVSSPLAVPAAALLSPFAVARTPIRLWGDALFDPFGAILVAIGLVATVRRAPRDRVSALLVVWLGVALLPGFVSSYDQPSLIRVFASPVPVAVLASIGSIELCGRILAVGARPLAMTAAAAVVIAGGGYLFDVVNPRILRSSALGIALRALDNEDTPRAVLLTAETEAESWLYVDLIATHVPERPVELISAERLEEQLVAPSVLDSRPELFVWTPAVEAAAQVGLRLCRSAKNSAIYTISDRTGLSRIYAARPQGHGWLPAVAREQWRVETCAALAAAHRPPLALAGDPNSDLPRADPDSKPSPLAASNPPQVASIPGDSPGPASEGKDLRHADLAGADLAGADLHGAQLASAVLSNARLVAANLSGADLRAANLVEADLTEANIANATFKEADLRGARLVQVNARRTSFYRASLVSVDLGNGIFAGSDLEGADLTGARLVGTDLAAAELIRANLGAVDLSGARVAGANMREANLERADLHGLDLRRGDLAGANLAAANLRGAKLPGLMLREMNIAGADLSDADLSGVDLGGSDLSRASLRGADLTGARMTGAVLAGADLGGAKLVRADLAGADLSGAIFADTDLTGASLAQAKLERVRLAGANLASVDLSGAELSAAKLAGVNLSGANLRDCDLRGADLAGADLRRARLVGADLTAAHLKGAKLDGVELAGTTLEGADLAGVQLSDADLTSQRLARADLRGATLARANLSGADLRSAALREADLREAALAETKLGSGDLRAANLSGATLSGTDLTAATLEGADLARAYLDGVVWGQTVCPDGSRSEDNGGTCCGHHQGVAPTSCRP
jgi:uncharacterized protein YjbI with pentapeptide repeats